MAVPRQFPGQDGLVAHEITGGNATQNVLSHELLDDNWSNTTAPLWFPHLSEGSHLVQWSLLNGETLNSLYI